MRFFGIDIASETHVAFGFNENLSPILSSFSFSESEDGYKSLLKMFGSPTDVLVGMEATGHYWQNLFIFLKEKSFRVCILNPFQVKKYSESILERTKTDAQDAKNIAHFIAKQNPNPTILPEGWILELKETVRFLDKLKQELGDKVRSLHRLVDLTFPEFSSVIKDLSSLTALTLLMRYPTAKSYEKTTADKISMIKYDDVHKIKKETAEMILTLSKKSVGAHHGKIYELEITCFVEDIIILKNRIKEINEEIENKIKEKEICKLLLTIEKLGINTIARVIAETNGLTHFESIEKLGSFVGVIPGLKQSGKNKSEKASLSSYGNVRLREKLWMPVLSLVRKNTWLKEAYEKMRNKGKPFKISIIASMRKLLGAMLSVARNKKPFVPLPQLQAA